MKVHAAVARFLSERGVDTLFGVIGQANMLIVDDFVRLHDGRYVNAAREDGAVMMADGFSRVSGRLGVATVTLGPGLTNTVTAMTEATRAGTPMLLVTGDTPAATRSDIQAIDQRGVMKSTGAGFQQVRMPHTAIEDAALAVRRTFAERRPIVLNIPSDLQEQEIDYVLPEILPPIAQAINPDPTALDRAVGLIASARRPLILAGRGAVMAGARDSLLRLAERIGAPVSTTLLAKDYFLGNPWNIGIFGTLASSIAGRVIAEADCIVAFGASLNQFTTSHGALVAGKATVQCDVDPNRIGQWATVDAGVVGDVGVVADRIVEWLNELEAEPSAFRTSVLERQLLEHSPKDEFEDLSHDETVDMRTATIALDELLPSNRTVVTDVGHCIMAAPSYVHVPEPAAFVFPANFGSVGLGLGAAIGAAVGRPDRPVVAFVGDGGLMMSLAEFNTAVRYSLDLTVVVLNDAGYGAEYHHFEVAGRNPDLTLFEWPDFASVAESLGGHGVTVRGLQDLRNVKKWFERGRRPLLIDIKLDPALHLQTCVL